MQNKLNVFSIMRVILLFLGLLSFGESSRVLELSDRFLEIRKEGQWLVMFYAPWCAHCKRLEPVWAHVAQALYHTNVRIGKVDCVKYTTIANTFGISGFPTIMFLKGEEKEVIFKGDRTKDEIVNFAKRLTGPPVQQITRYDSIEHLKTMQNNFFIYVGGFEGPLWEIYYDVAERFQAYSFFYAVAPEIVNKHVTLKDIPTVLVFKENNYYLFDEEKDWTDLNKTLSDWVNTERFESFVKITRGNIHQYMNTNKYLVVAVVAENKLEEVPEEMMIFRDLVKSVIINNRDRFHKWFQFGWIGSPELANSIAMKVLPLPYLLVVNSTTNHHHVPEDEPHVLKHNDIVDFLDSIKNQTAPCYGGNSFFIRIYRSYFEARASLSDMWHGNPVLTTVMFGLPFGFLSLLCYSIFCADILDADDEEDEEPLLSDPHEKEE